MKLNYGAITRAGLGSGLVKYREAGKNAIPIIMLEGERGNENDIEPWVGRGTLGLHGAAQGRMGLVTAPSPIRNMI